MSGISSHEGMLIKNIMADVPGLTPGGLDFLLYRKDGLYGKF